MRDNLLQDLLIQRGAPGRFAPDEALPTRKAEAWKYTDLKRLEKIGWSVWLAEDRHGVAALPEVLPGLEKTIDLVLVNGFLDRGLSDLDALPLGLSVEAGPAGETWGDGFTDRLSDALTQEELAIRIDAGRMIETPIHIRHITWGADADAAIAHAARVTITLERGAEATVIESHVTASGSGFSVPSLGVSLGDGSRLGLYTALLEHAGSAQIALVDIGIGDDIAVDDGLRLAERRVAGPQNGAFGQIKHFCVSPDPGGDV